VTVLTTYESREEWLAARAADYRVTASQAPQILGLSPYGGAFEVWAGHHAPDLIEGPTGSQLQAGLDDEPRALAEYARLTGALVEHVRHAAFVSGWAMASPDALVGEVGGVEVKHYDHPSWSEWAPSGTVWAGEGAYPVPEFVAVQALWSLHCSGRQWWDVVAVLPSGKRYPDTRIYTIMRHQPTIDAIVAKVTAWRDAHLVGGERPPFDYPRQGFEVVGKIHPRPASEDVLEADDDTAPKLARYAELANVIKAATDEQDTLRSELAAIIGDRKGLRGPAGSISWGSPSVRSSLSLTKVEAEAPDLAELLRERGLITTGETARPWRFTARKEKKS